MGKRTKGEKYSQHNSNVFILEHYYIFCLKVFGPFVHMLHLIDNERKPPMRYIYEVMNRAKETIIRSFNGNEENDKEIFKSFIRGEILSFIGFYMCWILLNLEFFYDKNKIKMLHDVDIISDLYKYMLRLTRNCFMQEKVVREVGF